MDILYKNYDFQVNWENDALDMSMAILAWIPRDMKTMPALTSNVEFGLYVKTGKLFYGRPHNAPKTRYLDHIYRKYVGREPKETLRDLVGEVVTTGIKRG